MEAQLVGDFPDRGPAVFAVATATLIIATVFVAARMVSRLGIVRRIGWDDYTIVLAWLIALFLCLAINFGTKRGLGRHDANIDPNDMPGLRMCEYVFSILYNPALMATKTSILIFYLRLAKNTQKVLRMASWVVLVIVNVAGVILTFMNIFQCSPVAAAWDVNVQAVRCIPLLTEFICSSPVNVITDLAILTLPLPVLTGMRLPHRQKFILTITFTFGIFVTVVDVVRIFYLQQAVGLVPMGASSDPSAIFGQSMGFPWNASLSLMWSAVEVNIGITCACIPTLKPLIIRILPAMIVDPDGTRRSSEAQKENHMSFSVSTRPEGNTGGESNGSQPGTTLSTSDSQLDSPQSPPTAHLQGDIMSGELSMRDFPAGLAAHDGTAPHRSSLAAPRGHHRGPRSSMCTQDNSVYFGFVNMKRPKSMLKTSASESFKYCTIVSILFFLWGFSYGLLNTLNNVVADVADMSVVQALGLTSIYFGGGYFFGPLLVGEWLLRHDEHHRSRRKEPNSSSADNSIGGFKATFIAGLLIYGTGTIIFWPSAVLSAYGGFMVSSFLVGFGLGVLETAANPFLALCGPPEYADARLLLAQGVQAVGSVLSGLLANKVFFSRETMNMARQIGTINTAVSTTLLDVQWTYLAVTLLSVLLALFFYYMPLPEVTDRELGRLATRLPVDPKKRSIGGLTLRTWCIILAVASQWLYVGAQENMSIFFLAAITAFVPDADRLGGDVYQPAEFRISTLSYLLIAHTAFALSRFTAGGLAYLSARFPRCRFIPLPRTMLLVSAVASTICVLVVVVLPTTANPNLIAIPIMLFFLAEGPMWPLIFSLGLRGQGKRTKRAAAWLTMGASGPAFWPFVLWEIIQTTDGNVQIAYIVIVALMAGSLVFPGFLWAVRDARGVVDPVDRDGFQRGEMGSATGGGPLVRRVSEAPEMTMEQIIKDRKDRRRTLSDEMHGQDDGGLLGRFYRGRWYRQRKERKEEKEKGKGRRGTGESVGMTPAVEHREGALWEKKYVGEGQEGNKKGDGEGRGETGAEVPPWERQVLDTSILEES
ncbi:major facilitator superfamily domain-containing protein [Bombardia bombarda]|uniref:Major facilitator superfamily domain-containing protein n=1 Tax=Bombardia bombarda TaxID=252184 RepID=A0AA40CFW1_9PEZI|nr:major facilitator superfamily domain-containing protein [Bombardia bombarda]